jgi:hypothetical protein
VSDVLHQYLDNDTLRVRAVTWEEYVKHYPVDARQQSSMQVVAESTATARPAYVTNPTTGKLEAVRQHNELVPPSTIVHLSLPSGSPLVVRVDEAALAHLQKPSSKDKKLILLHTKDAATNTWYAIQSGKTL